MAQGQAMGGGCSNRLWDGSPGWVVVTRLGVHMHKKSKMLIEFDKKCECHLKIDGWAMEIV